MEQVTAVREFMGIIRRRLPILIVLSAIGIGASAFVAYVLPPVFVSEARILVESQQIPDELARSTVTVSAAERLQLIEQRLMTRDNLLRVIDDLNLFADRDDLLLSEKIGLLRAATAIRPIELIRSSGFHRRSTGELSAFTIQVTFSTATDAARIANEFVTTILEQNLRARSERAIETRTFFEGEEDRLSQELTSLEVDITTYKKENENSLPNSLEFRRNELVRLAENQIEFDRKLLELEEQRAKLQTAITQLELDPNSGQLSPEQQQLKQLKNTLIQREAVLSPSHREIKALKAQIAALEAALPQTETDEGETTDLRSLQRSSLERQVALLDTQIQLVEDNKVNLEERMVALDISIQETPNIELTLTAMQRKREELAEQLAMIARKRADAQTGEKLEINRQAERFEVIENAIVPDFPVSPNRRKILMMGSVASIALAAALAFFIEIMNPAIRSAQQLERKLDLRPVVSIPYIRTAAERRRRRAVFASILLVLGIGVPAALAAIDRYYLPLELVGTKLAERTGLDEVIRVLENRL
ncbi:MAG: Wzz/FepE/Etk N-terminal domain-containing protein [Pseudomonadota bacterium]